MTDPIPAAPTTPPPPVPEAPAAPERAKVKIGDVIFGWKSAVVIFIGGLILGGLGGVGIGSIGHHHHPRGERIMHVWGGPGGYGYGGFQGGGGYVNPGGGLPIPPSTQQQPPITPKAPAPSASPKVNG